MVGNGSVVMEQQSIGELDAALREAYPELEQIGRAADGLDAEGPAADEPAAGGLAVYVVGGAVRDLLAGQGRTDLDLVVEGDPQPLAERLGGAVRVHDRFGTLTARLGSLRIDVAAARIERYEHPGALPEVAGAVIESDLDRRDFTINAMAVPVSAAAIECHGSGALLDPFGGRADLAAGVLRILHPESFRDDPTRALRGARYAARFGLEPDDETAAALARVDLATVSEQRRRAELLRLAEEPGALEALELLGAWGVIAPRPGGLELAARVRELLGLEPWRDEVPLAPATLAAALDEGSGGAEPDAAAGQAVDGEAIDGEEATGEATAGELAVDEVGVAEELTGLGEPATPSAAVAIAGSHRPLQLLLARAMGATWLDRYMAEWRRVRLEIDGADLLAAGVEEGPAIGRGLGAALRQKLDGELSGRETELAAALAAASGPTEEDRDALG